MFGSIGPLEIAIVLAIALVVFGPKRLPELGKSLGKGIREFKGSVSDFHEEDSDEPRQIAAPFPAASPTAKTQQESTRETSV